MRPNRRCFPAGTISLTLIVLNSPAIPVSSPPGRYHPGRPVAKIQGARTSSGASPSPYPKPDEPEPNRWRRDSLHIARARKETADFANDADMTDDHDEGLNRKGQRRKTITRSRGVRGELTGPRIAQKAALLFVVRASCPPS